MRVWSWLLRWGTAALAAAVSAVFAYTLSDNQGVASVLVALSIGCVLIEAHSLGWMRARRLEGDRLGVGLTVVLLLMACLYTAGMQLGFFGNVLMAPAAQDKSTASLLADAEKRVAELETAAGWLVRPAGSVSSLKELVDGYAAKKKLSSKDADALRQAKADLAAAKGAAEHDVTLQQARADVAKLKGKAPKDVKGKVFAWATRGLLQGDATTNFFVLLAVLVMQAAQIFLPIVTGAHGRKPSPEEPRAQMAPVSPPIPNVYREERPQIAPATPTPVAPTVQTARAAPPPAKAKAPGPISKRLAARPKKKGATRQRRGAVTLPPYDLPVNPNANVHVLRPNISSMRANIRKVG
jgi:hypothetical protein